MKKANRELLTLGLIGAAGVGAIAYFKPSVFSGIFSKPQVQSLGPAEGLRLFLTGIPNERYLLNASAAEGSTIPIWLATNKPFTMGPTGSLAIDLQAPTPSVVTMVFTEMKTGRKIKQAVPISPDKVEQSAYFMFRTAEGRMN